MMGENIIVGGIITSITVIGGALGKMAFVTKRDFKESQQVCQQNLCSKIDNVAKQVSNLADENKENHKAMLAIQKHMGKVEQYMKDRNGGTGG